MQTKPVNTGDPILLRLRALARDSPDLKEAARAYEAILPLLRDAEVPVGPVSLTAGQARAKLEMGLPLLHDLELDLDVEAVRTLMLRIVQAIEKIGKENSWSRLRLSLLRAPSAPGRRARRVRLALETNSLDLSALLPHIAAGEKDAVISATKALQLDAEFVGTLAQSALKPALRAWRLQVSPLAEGARWNRGICLICGAAATLGELRENHQVKHLRCGSCGADWRFGLLQCTCCGNEDHRLRRYLYAERQREKMRVEACDACKCYLKIISSFTPTPAEMLSVEDLATLHLDYIARERGYRRVDIPRSLCETRA